MLIFAAAGLISASAADAKDNWEKVCGKCHGPDGKGEIVFQMGPELYLLDLSTKVAKSVPVTIPGDRPKLRPRTFDASKLVSSFDVSSTGKRGIFEARGDIWTVPATKGSPRNLTRTSGVAAGDFVTASAPATGDVTVQPTGIGQPASSVRSRAGAEEAGRQGAAGVT